jgi:hypothetical protein
VPLISRPSSSDTKKLGYVLLIAGGLGLCTGFPMGLVALGAGALLMIGAGALVELEKRERLVLHAPPPLPKAPPGDPIPFETLRARYSRPAVALIRPYPPHRAPVGKSRFGGLPDLPRDVPWPSRFHRELKREAPLHFMAQIALDELPWRPDGFPTKGTLLFFAKIDETMDWDQDPVAVVYDRDGTGVPRPVPPDMPPIEGGTNDFDRNFGIRGEPGIVAYPSWPLLPYAIETMPDPEAIAHNAYHEPTYAGYHAALMQFRADQIARAAGRPAARRREADFPVYASRAYDRVVLGPHAETGFPWVARTVDLIGRAALRGVPKTADPALVGAVERLTRARGLEPSSPWPAAESQALIDALNALLDAVDGPHRRVVANAIDSALLQLVVESGGDPALAARIPDGIYEAARTWHTPIVQERRPAAGEADRPIVWEDGEVQRVQHHQMFGHVPGTQGTIPVDSTERTLLQLRSDLGANLMLCDMGEADFVLEAADLAAGRFDRVIGRTAGG